MASKAPPPLIRSSKAFSVEIPEGSNSAKARRSDVVGSDDLEIHKSSSNFQSQEPDHGASKGFHDDQPLDSGSAIGEHHATLGSANVQDHQESLKDRFAADQSGHAHADQMVHEDEHPSENLAKHPSEDQAAAAKGVAVVGDAHQDNLQGIADDALHDSQAGIAKDAIKDNLQGIANEALHDHLVDVAQDHDAVHKHAGLAKDAIQDNLQGVGNDAIQDNIQGVAKDAEHHNKAGLAKETEYDNKVGIPKDAIQDNKAGVAKDGITDNNAGIGKEHLEDHVVQLPSTEHLLQDGPKPQVHPSDDSATQHATEQSGSSQTKTKPQPLAQHALSTEEVASHAEALLHAQQEKAKRMEEFHGRVDAIRKTVSGINHKLDELDEDGAPIKH